MNVRTGKLAALVVCAALAGRLSAQDKPAPVKDAALSAQKPAAVGQEPAPMFPFVLPWDDASKTLVDVSALNPTPAGRDGFIVAKNGHFYDEKNRRIRFIGASITADNAFPDKATAQAEAARMHKFGFNIMRLHHMDASWSKPGIFDPAQNDTQHLTKDALDRLDYLIYQLKENGIYANLNLHVSRTYLPGDNLPETDKLPGLGKIVTFFYPRMIELQKQYARDLLTHLNPYTKLRYVEDPAVAVVEINNENTLLGAAFDGSLDALPPAYKTELARQWSVWLKTKYATTEGLRRAWSAGDKPYGPNLLENADFMRGAEHWTLERNTAPADGALELPENVPAPNGVAGKVLRVQVKTLGGQNWHLQLHQTGLDLTEGEPYTVSFWAKADRNRPLPVGVRLDTGDYHNIGLDATASLTTEWRQFTYAFTVNRSQRSHNRLSFVLGDALGTVDLAGVILRPGAQTEFLGGLSVEAATVPPAHPADNPAGRDWIAFLIETERAYMATMRDFLKKELKVRANITGSQVTYGGLGGALRETDSDFGDIHSYWQHPDFPRKQWDMADWRIANIAMTRDAGGGGLSYLAHYRLAGKPFTVSEYNHPAPNDFQAETIPLLTAFACLQDWDGYYLFEYGGGRSDSDRIKGFFAIDSNPAKMAFLPAAALMFLRNDLPLAREELRLHLSADNVANLMAKNGADGGPEWEAAGVTYPSALTHRLSLSFAGGKPAPDDANPAGKRDEANRPASVGPFVWRAIGNDNPVVTADSPSSKMIVGFLGGQSVEVAGWRVAMTATPSQFAAFTLSALDGRAMEQSRSLLLTAVGRVENTGMQWNADRTSVGEHWGTGPTLAEGVPGTVTITTRAVRATVYALDGTGKRLAPVPSALHGGVLTFVIGPAHKTLWYEVEAAWTK